MKRSLLRLVLPAAALALAATLWQPLDARAVPYTFSGTLSLSDPTFNRPLADLSDLSAVGTNVFYDVQPFSLSLAGSVTLSVNSFASSDGNDDSFLVLYQGAFNPASPLTNAVAANDDDPNGSTFLSTITASLLANTSYFLVTTTFENGVTGPYNDSITPANAATVVNVPEPSTYAVVVGAGLLLLGIQRARRGPPRAALAA